MIEERFESYVYEIMKYVKYQEDKPYIESILEDMKYQLFREDREYIKELEQRIDKAIEYIKTCNDKEILESMFLNESYISNYGAKELLEILGDKENE